jgi:type IV pilus assembly protein PilW
MTKPGIPMSRKTGHLQRGVSLVELMIACAIGLFIILAAIGLLLVSRQTYLVSDEQIAVQEAGHYALAILARSARQASWQEYPKDSSSAAAAMSAGIVGLDAKSLRMTSEHIENPIAPVSHGSDVLAIRFSGANDGSMLNCAGFAVSEAKEGLQGWSIFFVAGERNTEPELRCKYRGKSSWRTEGIVRGIESFQVLYGIDTDADGLPNQFLNADEVRQLNAELEEEEAEGEEEEAEEGEGGVYWAKVAAVKIAILVRSSRTIREAGPQPPYHLFGETYSGLYGASDRGTFIREGDIPQDVRPRLRKVFTTTIPLRNSALEGGG